MSSFNLGRVYCNRSPAGHIFLNTAQNAGQPDWGGFLLMPLPAYFSEEGSAGARQSDQVTVTEIRACVLAAGFGWGVCSTNVAMNCARRWGARQGVNRRRAK